MDFWDPVSELISVSPKSSNRSLGISRQLRDRGILIEDRPRTVDFSLRMPTTPTNQPESAGSATLRSGVMFQRPLPDGLSEELVDVRLPGGASRRDVWEWIKGLGDPQNMDLDELYGPIVAQEDIPTGASVAEGSRVPSSSHIPNAPDPGQRGRRGFQETISPTRGQALPASVDTTQIEGRARLVGGSQVDSIIQGLRDTMSDVSRNSTDGLLGSDDAAHGQGPAQHTQTRRGLTTPSQRLQPADLGNGGEFLARRTRVAALLGSGGYTPPSYIPYNGGLQDVFDDFSIYQDSDCREDDEGGSGSEKIGGCKDENVIEKSQGSSIREENIVADSLIGQVGSWIDLRWASGRDETEREAYVSVFSSRDGSSDRQIDDDEASIDMYRRQEAMARRRRRHGFQFQPGFSFPGEQHDPLGARLSATTDAARAFPSSSSSAWPSGGFGGTFPFHGQARFGRDGQSGGQRGSNNLFAHSNQSTGKKDKEPEQSGLVGNNAERARVYYGAEIVDIDRLDPLPPLPSLFPDRDTYRFFPLGNSARDSQTFMPETAQARSQTSVHSDGSWPFVLGADLLDDPFVRAPEPQTEQDLHLGDTHRETGYSSLPHREGRTDDLAGLADLFARGPESPIERPRNPGGFRRTPASTPDRSEQVQRPFVLGLDTIRHPFSDTPIVPDVPWSASTTLLSHPLTTMGRENNTQQEDFRLSAPGVGTDKQPRSTPSAPASSKEPDAPSSQSAARNGRPPHGPNVAGRQQVPNKEPQRVELGDTPKIIERPVGSLPASGSSEESQSGSDRSEAEPKFPEQIYNILLVGAAKVGKTSMIQSHVNCHWTDAEKTENSIWNRFLRKQVDKNRVYKMDSTIDSYNVKLVLWDASLQCAGEMLRKNDAGWDAVMLCCDLEEPWSLQEVMKWWMSHRKEIRPATAFPIVIELAGLKRDLLPPVRHRLSRENGEYNAGLIGGGARYTEVSAKMRENFREFWYGVVRRVRDGRVQVYEGEAKRWRVRMARAERKKRKERGKVDREVAGKGTDPKL